METKKKKKLLNGIMVLLILVIAASGLFTVGKVQGWFETAKTAVMSSGTVRGIANIERMGIGYTLKGQTVLQSEDAIETKKGAQVQLLLKEQTSFWLNGNTEVDLTEAAETQVSMAVSAGEVFGDAMAYTDSLEVCFLENKAMLEEAVFSLSVQSGSSSLNLYAGDIRVILADGTEERVEAGETLSVVVQEDGTVVYEINDLYAESLNEFLIQQLQECSSADVLCFSAEQLQEVIDTRAAEKQAALEASLNAERIAKKETQESESETADQENEQKQDQPAAEENDVSYSDVETYVPEEDAASAEEASNAKICTITILCNTILDNMENLDDGKEAYVPANGTILATSSVEFEEGETVFDVLNRVCEYAGIQIEYSWSPVYNSYYIEGINNLYEFDCGNESGWMYKVNGWFPNYGCSSYSLEDGDNIVWCYTCNGLGADVGGPTF